MNTTQVILIFLVGLLLGAGLGIWLQLHGKLDGIEARLHARLDAIEAKLKGIAPKG